MMLKLIVIEQKHENYEDLRMADMISKRKKRHHTQSPAGCAHVAVLEQLPPV
jgi:hypothetical protein